MAGNFRDIIFRDKLKEGSRINIFSCFNVRDCRAVGHVHQDPLALVHLCKLAVINFHWWKIS